MKRRYFIYFLKFKDLPYFKYGKSENLKNRLYKHKSSYDLDLKSSFFFEIQTRAKMSIAEKMIIAENTTKHNIFRGKEGWTEIAHIDRLELSMSLIADNNYFNMKTLKYKELSLPKKRSPKIKKVNSNLDILVKKKATFEYDFNFISEVKSFFSKLENLLITNRILKYKQESKDSLFLLIKRNETEKIPDLRCRISYRYDYGHVCGNGYYMLGSNGYTRDKKGNILYEIKIPSENMKKYQKIHFRNFEERLNSYLLRIDKTIDNSSF